MNCKHQDSTDRGTPAARPPRSTRRMSALVAIAMAIACTVNVGSQVSPAAAACADGGTGCYFTFPDYPNYLDFYSECRTDHAVVAWAPAYGTQSYTHQVVWGANLYRWGPQGWTLYRNGPPARWDHLLPYGYWVFGSLAWWKFQAYTAYPDSVTFPNLPNGYYQVRFSYHKTNNYMTDRGATGFGTVDRLGVNEGPVVNGVLVHEIWADPNNMLQFPSILQNSTREYCFIP